MCEINIKFEYNFNKKSPSPITDLDDNMSTRITKMCQNEYAIVFRK